MTKIIGENIKNMPWEEKPEGCKEVFWRSKKNIEARIFIIILSLIMSYLLTNFIVDFLSNSKIF